MSRHAARRLAAAVAAVGLVAAWQARRSGDGRLLAEAVAKLDAEEPGWRNPEADGAALPAPDRNAATVALAVAAKLPPSFRAWEAREFFRPGNPPDAAPDPADLELALAAHADCHDALATAAPLLDLPEGGVAWPIYALGATAPPELVALRDALGLLRLDALVTAHRRRPAEGAAAVARLFHLASGGYGESASHSAQYGRIYAAAAAATELERLLAWTEPNGADFARLQARCAAERAAPRLARFYRGYRAALARHLGAIESGAAPLTELSLGRAPGRAGRAVLAYAPAGLRGEVVRAELQNLEHFGALIAAESRPDPERATAAIRAPVPPHEPGGLPSAGGYAAIMWPTARDVAVADANLRARLACAEVAVACERFRLKTERWPARLAELPPGLLAAVPADPFTGGPLRYEVGDGGAVVYSAGPDLTDHGGREVVGSMTHTDRAGRDLGFRLWNPDRRRPASP